MCYDAPGYTENPKKKKNYFSRRGQEAVIHMATRAHTKTKLHLA